MHDNDLAGAEQLLRNDDAAQCICGSAAGIADYMDIAFFKTEGAGGILRVDRCEYHYPSEILRSIWNIRTEARIHASHHGCLSEIESD